MRARSVVGDGDDGKLSKNSSLKELACIGTGVTTLDVSRNDQLQSLNCDNTLLRELDLKQNPELKSLSCENIGLSRLDISENSNLEHLRYCGNKFQTIIVNKHPYMKQIVCDDPDMVMEANRNCEVG